MKKVFQIIGLISLTCFSFYITEKTVTVVNNMDEIMIEIKNKKDEYRKDYIDAIIKDDTIIPGTNGREININKSYKNMKCNGYFNENLFVYDYIKPKIKLSDNIDKYIIKGNPNKRMVSLIFILRGNDKIDNILSIINNYNVKASFFIDYDWFTMNNDKIKEIISSGHTVSPYLEDYTDSNFEWMDMVIKKVNKQGTVFCYNKKDNKKNIDICSLKGDYTIRPTVISDKIPLADIKNKIESGSLFLLSNNKEVRRELSTIIIYIKSKGFTLSNLEEHILE